MTNKTNATLWIMLLTGASVVTTLVFACATPYAALAAIAATRLRQGDGLMLMLVMWLAAQAIGFGVHHYPHDANAAGWAATVGIAAFAAHATARRMASGMIGGYVAAFATFKAVVAIGTLLLAGGAGALAPIIVARGFVREGLILVALVGLMRGLRMIGFPAALRPEAA